MAKYLIKFFVETPLRADEDIRFSNQGHELLFMFRSGNNTDKGIEVEVPCEAKSWREGCAYASNEIIPPVLDAIAFHRKTLLLLGGCRQILKSEAGQAKRKIVLVDPQRYPVYSHFHSKWTKHVQHILDSDPALYRLSLRWLRNSYRSRLFPERFIYTWLAFENLAGEIEKTPTCSGCRETLRCPKCGRPAPVYKTADRERAFEILKASESNLEWEIFIGWWTGTRNPLFHGTRRLDAGFFQELTEATEKIQPAVERHLEHILRIGDRNPAEQPVGPDRSQNVWFFLEFDAAKPEEEFSSTTPELPRLLELMGKGESTKEEMGCITIGEKAFESW